MVVILILYIIAVLVYASVWGVVTNRIIRGRGYHENWFWRGFLFTGFAAYKALSRPRAEEARAYTGSEPTLLLQNKEAAGQPAAAPALSGMQQEQILSKGGWQCVCGRLNPAYIGTCACGRNKPGVHVPTPQEMKKKQAARAEQKRLEEERKQREEQRLRMEQQQRLRMEQQRAAEAEELQKIRANAMDRYAALRELKGLLDDGIITQEEFDRKKKDYLS